MRSQGEKCAHNFLAPPAKIGGAGGWLKGQRKNSQKKSGGAAKTHSERPGAIATKREPPPPKGARKPEGRRPAKPREKRAAIAGPRRGGPGPGERRESTSERAAERDTGARSEKSKGGEAGRSLNPCPFVERSATPGGCRAEAFESAARGKSRTRSGG